MGEVYKARDTRLDRTVAIKVLPEHVASDPDLKQRFEREAKTISSLNHPHICTLYDIGGQDGIDFLVMEYLEGDTLAQRLEKGALPLDQALKVAIEIADALDKAHRQGITHRDLKPGNVMLTRAGATLLDFGLAKLRQAEAAGGLTALPTQEAPLTEQGTILGTFQYMAPEQLEGQEADARTDIFAFGAVVYEMATGKKAFEGKTQASLITAIMASEPSPISTVQSLSPPALDEIIKTCLAKDADERWQSAGDLGRQLKVVRGGSQPSSAVPAVAVPQRARWRLATPSAIAGVVIGSLITGIAVWSVTRPGPRPVARAMVTPPASRPVILGAPDVNVALTPDGTRLVYRATIDGLPYLIVRPLAELAATPLRGLTARPRNPFISPDGNWVGFFDAPGTVLYRVSILGGPPLTICTAPGGAPGGASWGADDTIIFATHAGDSGLWRVPAGGGVPEPLTTPNADEGERDHLWPEILPGGEAVLFTITTTGSIENSQIAVLTLENRETKVLIPGGSNPRYVPTGHIVYGVQGTLRAVTFDLDTLTVTSDPIPVVDGVNTSRTGSADFAVALDGSLVYATASGVGANDFGLVWVDRGGREEPVGAEPGVYAAPQLSPDGTRVALVRVDEGGGTTSTSMTWLATISPSSRSVPRMRAFRSGRRMVSGSCLHPTAMGRVTST